MSKQRAARAWCSACEADVRLERDAALECPNCGGYVDVLFEATPLSEPTSEDEILANEKIFRGINEQLRAQAGNLSETELVEFVCECGRLDCDASIYLSDAEYRSVREHELWFFSIPGHELPEEAVIDRHERYVVLDKTELASDGEV